MTPMPVPLEEIQEPFSLQSGKVVSLYPGVYSDEECQPELLRKRYIEAMKLLQLPVGWDGHDGKKISPGTILFCLQMLSRVSPETDHEPALVPLSYGGVQIEWHTEKADLEIEFVQPNYFSIYFEDAKTREGEEREGSTDFSSIQELLDRI